MQQSQRSKGNTLLTVAQFKREAERVARKEAKKGKLSPKETEMVVKYINAWLGV
jgi:hypothetical protein